MKGKITEMIMASLKGSHKVKIMFDPESTTAIAQLLILAKKSEVEISESDSELLEDIVLSGVGKKHPVIILSLNDQLNEEWFTENVGPAIETIEFA